jgi:hypothetical protein
LLAYGKDDSGIVIREPQSSAHRQLARTRPGNALYALAFSPDGPSGEGFQPALSEREHPSAARKAA